MEIKTIMLLLLSHFSRVWLCATPQTAAHQAPLSLGFSRQEHWSGLPFPSPMHERKSESQVTQSCTTLNDPMDCSLPGSSVPGIFQARVLEWGAIAFSMPSVRRGFNSSWPSSQWPQHFPLYMFILSLRMGKGHGSLLFQGQWSCSKAVSLEVTPWVIHWKIQGLKLIQWLTE